LWALAAPLAAGGRIVDGSDVARLAAEAERLEAELSAVRQAAPAPDQDRVRALEAELARLREELRRLAEESKETAAAVDSLARAEERRTTVTVYGNLEATAFSGQHALLDGRNFELVLSGHPHKQLSFFAEIEFEQTAGVGGPRGGEIVVEQAFANFNFASLLNLRAGVLLVPFGNVNIDHFAPKREVVTRPLVSYVVAPSDWTDNGLGIYGKKLLGTSWLLSYEVDLVAGLSSEITGQGMRDARQGYGVDNNGNKAVVGRIALNRASRLEIGLSGYTGNYDDLDLKRLNGWAVDALALLGPVKLTGEYNQFVADRAPERDTRLRGYYVRAVWDFGRSLLARTPLGRDFDEPRLAVVAQHDQVWLEGPVGTEFQENQERRDTLGINFRPSTQWVLKLTYERNATSGQALVRGDRDGWAGAIGFIF
jgi:hypothetical protein